MTYERTTTRSSGGGTRGSDRVDVRLPRRSLQIQSGDARYAFAHSIANENLLDPRRVSITFRESRTPSTRTTTRGK
jgi:alkylated DNA repair protein alkB family protein 4